MVIGMTMSSFEALEAECLIQFGVAPRKSDCRGNCIKLTWLRDLKENLELTDDISIQRYVRCHIMLLIGTILFGDKSGVGVHWKFLPLLRDFVSIGQYSWGMACLAHLYRALCRASRFNCKEIDGPLTLLLGWAWIRLPYLSPLPREPHSFPLANRWRNWERGDRRYRYLNLAHFRKAFDELQEGHFVWVAYTMDRVDPNIIPAEIYMQSVVWSATVPLVSFECIEWHATDRFRRQYNYVLSELPMPSQHPLDCYMYWYRSKFGDHLNLSNLVGQENDEGNHDMDEDDQDMDEDNQNTDEGSQDMDDDNEEQEPHSPHILPPNPIPEEQPQSSNQYVPQTQFPPSFPISQQYWDAGLSQYGHQPEFMAGRYSLDARYLGHTSSVASGGFVSVDSSRSEGGRGVLNSQNPNRISMGLIEENANTLEKETDAYLVDDPNDEDDDEEDEIEEFDEDEESRNDGQERTPDDKVKGYNMRIDPPRRSANRYTPSVFKKAAKKCKNFVKDVKWTIRK
ncbi:hypothetical protein Ahy_A07g034305 [Arachis hypogaea]|uniref:Aminotransferase-like plant mobile domain-containing protein n=1 Tax=Arachis hypogaea TaxID=3818 RepID=A0A445CBR5_ARAHY|nr:hypothetical protein Ahy_A07g034305 [Arachis hypogaea]